MSGERGTERELGGGFVLYRARKYGALMVQHILKFMTACQATTATDSSRESRI